MLHCNTMQSSFPGDRVRPSLPTCVQSLSIFCQIACSFGGCHLWFARGPLGSTKQIKNESNVRPCHCERHLAVSRVFSRAHNYQLLIDALDHNLPAAAIWCNREMQLTDQVQEMQEMQPFSSIGVWRLS